MCGAVWTCLSQIVSEVRRIDGMADVEFTLVAEAKEYRETVALQGRVG